MPENRPTKLTILLLAPALLSACATTSIPTAGAEPCGPDAIPVCERFGSEADCECTRWSSIRQALDVPPAPRTAGH